MNNENFDKILIVKQLVQALRVSRASISESMSRLNEKKILSEDDSKKLQKDLAIEKKLIECID